MGKANFTDDFKRDAVAQITERGYSHRRGHNLIQRHKTLVEKSVAKRHGGKFYNKGIGR